MAEDIAAEDAIRLLREGQINLIDVRSTNERAANEIPGAIKIQFGPDVWSNGVTTDHKKAFVSGLQHFAFRTEDEIVIICNIGRRSSAAASFLRSSGFVRVRNVSGGFYGNTVVPGWEFYQ